MEHSAQSVNVVISGIDTAGNPNFGQPYIGDFPPRPTYAEPFIVQPSIIPAPAHPDLGPVDAWPQHYTNSWVNIGSVNPWKLEFKHDRVVATIDVPGCKANGIELSLSNGKLSVKATRAKAGGYSSFDTFIGTDYDPETAEAEVEDGVLTVSVLRFKDKIEKKIPVKAK